VVKPLVVERWLHAHVVLALHRYLPTGLVVSVVNQLKLNI
jgi:hypothetical protein